MLDNSEHKPAKIALEANRSQVICSGDWITAQLAVLTPALITSIKNTAAEKITINVEKVSNLDTAGAFILQDIIEQLKAASKQTNILGFSPEQQALYDLIANEASKVTEIPEPERHNILYSLGQEAVAKFSQALEFLSFQGELFVEIFNTILNPKLIQWRGFFNVVDAAGYRSLPIIALLLFLIGLVLAYEMGLQLRDYGANIYIVSLSGAAVLQEFGPLITAIIIAGRTGAAFTAELGAMKVNQEIDVLQTMGVSPMSRLVLPRFFGLMVALPLLTIWADIFGILGAMVMAKNVLGISYYEYISRIPLDVKLSNYWIGMCKAPVFAMIIATVGCFQGFSVGFSADSIGQKTTKSVVQAIFLIIIVDSLFSVLFGW